MKIIGFIGAPCAGKSTAASHLFNRLKLRYLKAELVLEAAKKHSYADTSHLLSNQVKIFSEQNEMFFYFERLEELARNNPDSAEKRIDYVVTDSPLILSAFYSPDNYPASFKQFVIDMFKKHDNLLIYLERNHPYDPAGRYHTEAESREIEKALPKFLDQHDIPYIRMQTSEMVALDVLQHLQLQPLAKDVMLTRCNSLMTHMKDMSERNVSSVVAQNLKQMTHLMQDTFHQLLLEKNSEDKLEKMIETGFSMMESIAMP